MWYQATNLFEVSGKANSGSQHGTKTQKNERNRSLEILALLLILSFHCATLCFNSNTERHVVGQYQRSWSTEKKELWSQQMRRDKREEIPGEDRQHVCIWNDDGNPWLTWLRNCWDVGQSELFIHQKQTLATVILLAEKESEFFIEGLLLRFVFFLKHIRGMKSDLTLLGFSA